MIEEKKAELLYQTAKDNLQQQLSSVDSFTIKTGLVLATSGVIVAGYLQLLSSPVWFNSNCKIFLFLGIVSAFTSVVFAFLSLIPGIEKNLWKYDPDPEKLFKLHKEDNIYRYP